MKKINFALIAFVVAIVQNLEGLFNFDSQIIGDIFTALLFVSVGTAVISLIFEHKNRTRFVMAIAALLLSLGPILLGIILVYGLSFRMM